jgi:type VI secretion system secreted protein VgrG
VYCDRLGRVKIRFPGTRPADHERANGAGTLDTEADSAWVRVASNWAGNGPGSLQQCGTVTLPRIGTEVLVNFLGGDPDKPVIVGQLYNEVAEPAGLSCVGDLPGNRYLSGTKSREIKGRRGNQIRFDDTSGQISAQLSSDHGCSELNIGFLTQPRFDGDAEIRGEGAELRTDKAIGLRGAHGVLISASAQIGAEGHFLEREELCRSATLAAQISDHLAQLAQKYSADPNESSGLPLLAERISSWTDSEGNEKARAPIVAVSAPAGHFVGSQGAIALGAQSTIDLVSSSDSRISSARNLLARASRGISMLAFKCGIKIVAASGNIRIQTHNGDIEITSLKKIKLIANENIEIQSPSIKIIAKGCQSNYEGGAITQESSGLHTIKSSKFIHKNGGDGDPERFKFIDSDIEHDQQVMVKDFVTDVPVVGRRYRITVEDGQIVEGTTDENGLSEKFKSNIAFATYHIELLD